MNSLILFTTRNRIGILIDPFFFKQLKACDLPGALLGLHGDVRLILIFSGMNMPPVPHCSHDGLKKDMKPTLKNVRGSLVDKRVFTILNVGVNIVEHHPNIRPKIPVQTGGKIQLFSSSDGPVV